LLYPLTTVLLLAVAVVVQGAETGQVAAVEQAVIAHLLDLFYL
jgi:hypothetical protein